ncbi:MAG: glycosyltransferase family 9 protein, partial [Bdellovibrionales bacterium]
MRILVLQLARFGDIYQTWPTLQALKRKHPGCELHVLVRNRFQEAAQDFPGITVHALPTQEIMRPLFEGLPIEASHEELRAFLQPLCDTSFDAIINLSFSPASSYLTDYLASSRTEVRGYTRHSDGHFNIPDDTSAYFYAQVGIGRANRYHLTEIFAAVAGVDLSEDDFRVAEQTYAGPRHGIVVHLGASTAEKIYPPELWVSAIREILETSPVAVTLVGSAGERGLAETVTSQLSNPELTNRVGETSLRELFQTVNGASLLIGADSAPVHIASLTQTPVLNLSSSSVNFWETGPLAAGSRVLYHENIQKISP